MKWNQKNKLFPDALSSILNRSRRLFCSSRTLPHTKSRRSIMWIRANRCDLSAAVLFDQHSAHLEIRWAQEFDFVRLLNESNRSISCRDQRSLDLLILNRCFWSVSWRFALAAANSIQTWEIRSISSTQKDLARKVEC